MSEKKGSVATVLTAILVLVGSVFVSVPASAHAIEVEGLRVNGAQTPLGIDNSAPRFSWTVTSQVRGTEQESYRIKVATDPEMSNIYWDSGEVTSSSPFGAVYVGADLKPATRYFWSVDVTTNEVERASETSWFETGIGPESWEGSRWISGPLADESQDRFSIDGANWIWYDDGMAPNAPEGHRYFRYEFDGDVDAVSVEIAITADDEYRLFFDGELIGESSDDPEAWREARVYPLSPDPGTHIIAVEAFNRDLASGNVSPAGLLAKLRVTYADGTVVDTVTDSNWLAIDEEELGWNESGFNDSHWQDAVEHAPYGEGEWGSNVTVVTGEQPAPLLRQEFNLDNGVEKARLYVAAGGVVTSRINGEPVSDSVLDVATTDYDERVLYATYDVTNLLEPGGNALGFELGRGFYGLSTVTSWNWENAPWHAEPAVRAVLDMTLADGNNVRIATGEGWRTQEGPTRADSMYEGDVYDARYAHHGYDMPDFDDAAWSDAVVVDGPGGKLVARSHSPIKVVETIEPMEITNPSEGVYVAHFPRQIAGWSRIAVQGDAGDEVTLRYAERLDEDGNIDLSTGFTKGAFQTDRYTLAGTGGQEVWEPSFSYKGFAYVEITGWPGQAPTVDEIEGRLVHNDMAQTGSFTSSNKLFNAIYDAAILTVLNNFHHLPTDTPKYEKNGWTGDGQIGAQLFMRNLDVVPFLEKWLDDISDSRSSDGRPALIAPDPDWHWAGHMESPTWNSAYVLIPWWIYEYSGETHVLERHYNGILSYLQLEHHLSDNHISSTGLGDYLPPDAVGNPPEDMRVAATAYVYLMTETAAKMADVLNHSADAKDLRIQAEAIRKAFNDEFYDGDDGMYVESGGKYRQTHNVLPLAFGITPDGEEQRVADNLARNIVEEHDSHLWTGVLGTKYLLPVLTDYGYGDLAYSVATQTDFPSWGRWFEEGSTSLWEHWGDYRSRNHYFLGGTIDDWFHEYLAGVTLTKPGYEAFKVEPHELGEMTHAAAKTRTPFGEVSVEWVRDDDRFGLSIKVPVGTTAQIVLPVADDEEAYEGDSIAAEAAGVSTISDGEGEETYEVVSGLYNFVVEKERETPPPSPTEEPGQTPEPTATDSEGQADPSDEPDALPEMEETGVSVMFMVFAALILLSAGVTFTALYKRRRASTMF